MHTLNTRGAIILDRDGTILIEKTYLNDERQVELLPEAAEGLRRMQQMGWPLVVITNQSAIARGYLDEPGLSRVHARMNQLLMAEGVHLDGIYHCPHRPENACACRKPKPALVLRAARELRFNPAASFVIGDKDCDIQLGQAVGAQTILVRTGYGRQFEKTVRADWFVNTLLDATTVLEHRARLALAA